MTVALCSFLVLYLSSPRGFATQMPQLDTHEELARREGWILRLYATHLTHEEERAARAG